MNYWCKSCWTPKLYGKDKCRSCSHQPGLTDQHMWNPITCKFGYKDCVNDPDNAAITAFASVLPFLSGILMAM